MGADWSIVPAMPPLPVLAGKPSALDQRLRPLRSLLPRRRTSLPTTMNRPLYAAASGSPASKRTVLLPAYRVPRLASHAAQRHSSTAAPH